MPRPDNAGMESAGDELSQLRARLDAAERMIVEQDARIQKLLEIIDSLRRGNKRQAAPFLTAGCS